MIITRLIGGLGNQLFQYAVARQLALQSGAQLKIDISCLQQPDARKYKLDLFNIKAPIASSSEIRRYTWHYEGNSLAARAYRKFEKKLLPKHKWLYFTEANYYHFEPALLKVSNHSLLEGFWQHHRYFENISPQLLQELSLRKEHLQNLPPLFEEIQQNHSSVSLHIRRGDYVSDPNNLSWFGVMPLEYYSRAVEHMGKHVNNPTYYVFSDDLSWAKANLKLDAPVKWVDLAGGTKDYLELEAMRNCRHNIIANSSFSWWAAYLNTNPGKIVIAPKQWVASEYFKDVVAIQFPEWIKL